MKVNMRYYINKKPSKTFLSMLQKNRTAMLASHIRYVPSNRAVRILKDYLLHSLKYVCMNASVYIKDYLRECGISPIAPTRTCNKTDWSNRTYDKHPC